MNKIKKYYAVKVGKNKKIFINWDECKDSINKYPKAEYKSFDTYEAANAYMNNKDLWEEIVNNDINKGYVVAFCDGSYNKELKYYSYGVLIINLNNKKTTLKGYDNDPKYVLTNNISGEIFGVLNTLEWCLKKNYKKIKIYHDYIGLSKFINNEWEPKSAVAKMYVNTYLKKFASKIDVVFKKVKAHNNNKYNEKADQLANEALNELFVKVNKLKNKK